MSKLHPQTLKFLSSIKKNNNRPWFEKNKPTYEAIKDDMVAFMAALIKEVSKFDPAVKDADPKKSVMRIYRDIRFSKDKSPYKTNIGAGISSGKITESSAGYYIHIMPGESFLGGGIWMPESEKLQKIRQEIDYNFKDFKKIVEANSFKKTFGSLDRNEKLTRPPKNYSPDNPAIEYLMLKSFTCGCKLSDADVLSDKLVKRCASVFKEMYPFVKFLNQAVA
ncbi:MAG TPA: DUF2461 domain-containing protein [Chitinophagales bacterium]|nr:DUF2461 domain-containing protein [Chitinophagales bacterium]